MSQQALPKPRALVRQARMPDWRRGSRLRRRAAAPAHVVRARPRVGRPRGRPSGAPRPDAERPRHRCRRRPRSTATACRSRPCRAICLTRDVSATAVLAGHSDNVEAARRRQPRPRAVPRARGSCACATGRRPNASAARSCSARPARPAGGSRWRSTRARAASRACRTACTGTTRSRMRSSRSGRRPRATPRRSSSPACRGGPAGATRNAAGDTSTGTAARCCPSSQAAAASAGFGPRLRTLFPDAQVAELVGADPVTSTRWRC